MSHASKIAAWPLAGLALLTAVPAAAQNTIAASVLPSSRSVMVGNTATVFATMVNAGSGTVTGCAIAPATSMPMNFAYQTTNSTTNALTGSPNTPVSIGGNGLQSFVLSFQPTGAFDPTTLALSFSCSGTSAAQSTPGVNTVLLSGSTTPVPDLVAVAATAGTPGLLSLSGSPAAGAFAVATINLGSADTITASINTGKASLPLALAICKTAPSSSACSSPLASSVSFNAPANATPAFSVFATAGTAIPFDPANSRIFVQFTDSTGAIRGSTSVAVMAAAPYGMPPNPYH